MDETNSSEKPGETLVEATSRDVDGPKVDESISENLAKSRFDNMSVGQTAWVFRRVAFISLAVYTGYVCEGFELKAGNSIIANAGFIKQFGRENGSGVAALNPTWGKYNLPYDRRLSNIDQKSLVSTWSSLLNVGQLVTLVYISWFAENFGRKASFYVAWIWLVVGCIFLNTAKTPAVWALGKLCNGAGVGVLQVICQVYIMEICPNKIRGGMISFQAVWSNSGSIICAVMMEQLNKHHPDNYLLAVRILWAPIGLMILFWVFVPESPWYYARRGDKEKAMKSMRKLYGNVEGYEFEEEYNIIVKTIQHEREMLSSAPNYIHLFQGSNLGEEAGRLTGIGSRSAAEIDELYERKIPVWRWSETVTSAEEQMRAVFLVKAGVDQGSKKALTQE
ncbi:uncharacterized protein Aud_003861 [Aspergillus udagawae]|uniref:Major facilitator superfamily (MFS) profile domain-containing protein n=1 Tax=Aspergillus udagawae TaxID=91492 RepID=A0A8E0UVK4_9EURO|nr:uncharacterized protein Aud_003861 [Aspergillus udagawae]GIC87477.1 hypothetical protein Aud_003861 [Aspergillus udagawae]